MEIKKVGVLGCGLMGSGIAPGVRIKFLPEPENRARVVGV
jgi:hypothetical protein